MARVLHCFQNFIPNYDNGSHFFFTDPNDFLDYVKYKSQVINEVTMDNYRINSGVIKVSKKFFHYSDFPDDLITYFIDCDIDDRTKKVSYWRCYRSVSFIEQSDYFVFTCEIDNWATYIWQAKLSNIHVTRSNADITGQTGIYDPILNVKPRKNIEATYDVFYSGSGEKPSKILAYNRIAIVFTASAVVRQEATGENVTANYVLGFSLSDALNLFSADVYKYHSLLEIAIRLVSGIYSSATNYSWIDNKISVQSAFIVVDPSIDRDPVFSLKTKTPFDSAAEKTITCYSMFMYRRETDCVFRNSGLQAIDHNKVYYIGTKDNGLRLEQRTQDMVVNVIEDMGTDGYHCVIKQGNNEKDITNAFKVSIMGSNTQLDTMEKIGFWTKTLVSHLPMLIGGIAASIATENPIPAIGAAIGATASTTASLTGNNTMANTIASNSDGLITFELKGDSGYGDNVVNVQYPFLLTEYESTKDEYSFARLNGVSYDCLIPSIQILDNYDQLGTGTFRSVYVMADMQINGLPIDARNDIYNTFKNGVYLAFRYYQ